MTASEVMNEIKAMTPEERAQVAEFLRQLENEKAVCEADDGLVEKLSDRILKQHEQLAL